MSKCSPYISCASIDDRLRHAARRSGAPGRPSTPARARRRCASAGCTACRAGAGRPSSSAPSAGRAGPCRRAPPLHAVDDRVGDRGVRRVAPPREHVGLGQHVVGSPCSGSSSVAVRTSHAPAQRRVQPGGDRRVDAVGVERAHVLLLALVHVLVPHRHSQRLLIRPPHLAEPGSEELPDPVDRRLAEHDFEEDARRCRPPARPPTTRKSSSSTPSESSTTPRAGRVSRPVKGGARKAPAHPAITSTPKTMLLSRWSNRHRSRGREKRSSRRIRRISARDEALLARPGELESTPPVGQPDRLAAEDELEREHHGDDLEDVGRAAGRQRQRRHPEQHHEEHREALPLEDLDEAAQRLLAVALQPAFELGV